VYFSDSDLTNEEVTDRWVEQRNNIDNEGRAIIRELLKNKEGLMLYVKDKITLSMVLKI